MKPRFISMVPFATGVAGSAGGEELCKLDLPLNLGAPESSPLQLQQSHLYGKVDAGDLKHALSRGYRSVT